MNKTEQAEIHSALATIKWVRGLVVALFPMMLGIAWHFHETAQAQAARSATTEIRLSTVEGALADLRAIRKDISVMSTSTSVLQAKQQHVQNALAEIVEALRERPRRRNR